MKKILILASVFAAFGLVACGDDSGSSASSKISCLVKEGDANSYCISSKYVTADECTASEETDLGWGGTVVDACPEAAIKECSTDGEDYSVYNESGMWMCEE